MFKKIMVGNDHGGVSAKNQVVEYLKERGIEVVNIGTDTEDIVRYPYYASRVAKAVKSGEVDGGILICSTGIGMSIIANKYKGIRASLCTTHNQALMTRRHNNSNILCLGGKTVGAFEVIDILEGWLEGEYEGGRHAISLAMIEQASDAMISDDAFALPQDLTL